MYQKRNTFVLEVQMKFHYKEHTAVMCESKSRLQGSGL